MAEIPLRIAIIGANGQLGSDLVGAARKKDHQVLEWNHDRVDICKSESIRTAIDADRPDAVINTAAYHNVPLCEERPADAFAVNAVGVRNLAIVCREFNMFLVHTSTDYVFDGRKGSPYRETDCPAPQSVYSISKYAGEQLIRNIAPRYQIVRVSGIYGQHRCRAKGQNFVEKMLFLGRRDGRVRVTDDEVLAPSYTAHVAEQMVRVCRLGVSGIFHVSNTGSCSWYQFARRIFRLAGVRCDVDRAAPGEFSQNVRRPAFSVLDNAMARKYKLPPMPSWQDGLASYFRDRPE